MYKIQPLSDLHVEFYKNNKDIQIANTDSDLIILAGDIHVKTKAIQWLLEQNITKPIIYVCGNHEFYSTNYPYNIGKLKEATKNTNIYILENGYFIYKDLVILGCTLWTDYKLLDPVIPQELAMVECQKQLNDFKYIRNSSERYRRLNPKDCLDSHLNSLTFLKNSLENFKGYKVGIVTHHPPIAKCLDPKYKSITNAGYASNLDKFVAESNALFWVSGHTHYSVDYMLGNTRIISNPKGYNTDLNPYFIKDLVVEF